VAWTILDPLNYFERGMAEDLKVLSCGHGPWGAGL